MHLLLLCQIILLLTPAPRSDELRNRYGYPYYEQRSLDGFLKSESFSVKSWASLTAHYGPDQRACRLDLAPGLGLEKSAQYQYVFGDSLFNVLEEVLPIAKRGKEFGDGDTKERSGLFHVTEYENLLIKQRLQWGGVSDVTISFKREGCPKPPITFLPPLDASTILALTPTSEELQERYGPNFGLGVAEIFDLFVLEPNIRLGVKYDSDHRACEIEIQPADTLNPEISTKRVFEIFGEVAPFEMRRKLIGGGTFRSSACNVASSLVYENVEMEQILNFCGPKNPPAANRATIKFKRDACQSPHSPVATIPPNLR